MRDPELPNPGDGDPGWRRRGSKLLEVISKRKRTPLRVSEPSLAAAPLSKCGGACLRGQKVRGALTQGEWLQGPGAARGAGAAAGGEADSYFASTLSPIPSARERAAEGTVLTRARW